MPLFLCGGCVVLYLAMQFPLGHPLLLYRILKLPIYSFPQPWQVPDEVGQPPFDIYELTEVELGILPFAEKAHVASASRPPNPYELSRLVGWLIENGVVSYSGFNQSVKIKEREISESASTIQIIDRGIQRSNMVLGGACYVEIEIMFIYNEDSGTISVSRSQGEWVCGLGGP